MLIGQNDSDGEEKDKKTAQMPVSDALDQSGLPDRRKAGRVFGKDTRKCKPVPTSTNLTHGGLGQKPELDKRAFLMHSAALPTPPVLF